MMNGLPNILILKKDPIFEQVSGFNVYYFTTDQSNYPEYHHGIKFDVVVTSRRPFDIPAHFRTRCFFVEENEQINLDELYKFYIDLKIGRWSAPIISVFTPLYNTKELLWKTFNFLTEQTFSSWEWVLIDDSDDDETWKIASAIADTDFRVKLFKQSKHSGNIGYLKNKAASLCDGSILVELDHDDLLTRDALEIISDAFMEYPEADYLYSDSVELMENNGSHMYGPGFGVHCGKYYDFEYFGEKYKSASVPINCWTVRHNVGLPNHVRAWRKEFYQRIGGHSYLPVGDDHELSVRSFLNTRIIHVKRCLYFQRIFNNGSNTTNVRNAEIQRVSHSMIQHHSNKIHERILELGYEDHCWDNINKTYNIDNPPEKIEDYCISFLG